jgi:hypothetical protein
MSRACARLLVVLATAALGGAAPAARLPGPAPQERAPGYDAAAENATCEACHSDVAAEWRGSLHRRAWEDPVFITAYAVEPIAFCRACHAPEADPAQVPAEGARRVGVGCVTCHVVSGAVVGPRGRAPGPGSHAVRAEARLAGDAACERCHQFAFPRPQEAPMQGTGDEHRASAHAGEPCQACHMPLVTDARGQRHRSHAFRVIGDPALIRSAVAASAEWSGPAEITVTLSARAGHDVPTGDMFRRLVVRAREGDVAAPPVVLARRFGVTPGPGGPRRVQTGDDRLPGSGDAQRVRLSFPVPAALTGRAARWEVVYERMDPALARTFGIDPTADEVIVAGGALPPRSGAVRP